jgi:hypothetical protein
MDLTQWQRDQIDEIMDYFDFDRVHKVMTLINWRWGLGQDAHVPDKRELRSTARVRLQTACDEYNKNGVFSCNYSGGLRGECDEDFVKLSFILADWPV